MVGPMSAARQVVRRDDLRAELAAAGTSVERAQELCDALSAALAAAMLEPELRELVESELHFHVRGAAWWSNVIRDRGHPTLGAATAAEVTAALDSAATQELPPLLAAWRQECAEALMAAHMIFAALPKLAELGDATTWPAADARGVVRNDADGKPLALLDVLALGIPPPPVRVEPDRREGRIAARGALQARAVASETVDMLVPGTALLPGMPVPGFSRSWQPRLLPTVANERIPPWGPLYLADAAGIPTASRGRGGPAPLAQRLAVEMMLAVPRGARANHPDGGRYSLALSYRDLARAIWPRGRRGKTWNRSTDWPALWKAMIAVNGCGIPYHDQGTTGVWFPVTVEGGPRVFAVTGPDGTAAPPPLETEVRFTVTLPPDGGRGPLIHIPTMREYGYSAPAYRAYLGLCWYWDQARRRAGYRLASTPGASTVQRVYEPLTPHDLVALCFPNQVGASGGAFRARLNDARTELERMERQGLLHIQRGPDGWRLLPTNEAHARPDLIASGERALSQVSGDGVRDPGQRRRLA